MTPPLILASASPFRRMLIQNAGLAFTWKAAAIDERAIEAALERDGSDPQAVALALAKAKANDVASAFPNALVIGSDQTMSLDARVYHKPRDLAEARSHLLSLSGKTHRLNSAVALVQNGEIVWEHVSLACLTMRALTPDFVDRHLARVGHVALSSVGAYQLEAEGIQLFEAIDGDYFTILGLPMLPLLKRLRELEAIDA